MVLFSSLEKIQPSSMMIYAIILIIISSFLNYNYISFIFGFVFFIYVLFFSYFWSLDEKYIKTTMRANITVFALFSILSIAVYFPPQDRWLGGMHPNSFGQLMIIMALMCAFYWSRIFPVIFLLAEFCAISVSSRFAIVAIAMVALLKIATLLRKKMTYGVMALMAAPVLGIFSLASYASGILNDVLELSSEQRGLGSGFTGRDRLWANFWPQINENPFFGYGFRNKDMYLTTHNAYLNIIIENGIIIGTLILIIITSVVYTHMRNYKSEKNSQTIYFILCSIFILFFTGLFQPQLINFGDVGGILFISLISSSTIYVEKKENHLDSDI